MKGTFYSCSSQSCDQFWENEQQAIEVFLEEQLMGDEFDLNEGCSSISLV